MATQYLDPLTWPVPAPDKLALVTYAGGYVLVTKMKSDETDYAEFAKWPSGEIPAVSYYNDTAYYVLAGGGGIFNVIGDFTAVFYKQVSTGHYLLAPTFANDKIYFVMGSTDFDLDPYFIVCDTSWNEETTIDITDGQIGLSAISANEYLIAVLNHISGSESAYTSFYDFSGALVTQHFHSDNQSTHQTFAAVDTFVTLYVDGTTEKVDIFSKTGTLDQTLTVATGISGSGPLKGVAMSDTALYLHENNGEVRVWDRAVVRDESGDITSDVFTNNSVVLSGDLTTPGNETHIAVNRTV